MLKTKQLSIYEQLQSAQNQIKSGSGLFVSVTIPIDWVDAIDFFASHQAKTGERFFWKSPNEELVLVGIGQEDVLSVEEATDRFIEMETKVKQRLSQFESIGNDLSGTGPIYFGGFSFFNDENVAGIWSSFPNAQLVLPKYMLSQSQQQCFLTFNQWIDEHSSINNLAKQMDEKIAEVRTLATPGYSEQQQDELVDRLPYEQWEDLINKAVKTIKSGQLGKVVLARQLEAKFDQAISIESVMQALDDQQEQSYLFVMENGQDTFIGATPERLVEVKNQKLQSACLAGTTSRGSTVDEDDMKAWQLLNDEKNLQEHHYVVKMIYDAINPYCDAIDIPSEPIIRKLSKIQHLFTPVEGVLKDRYTIFDTLKKLHPTPALGGEPRQLAMDYIKEHEPMKRGWYAAPIGWVDHQLDGEFAVAIRSGLIRENQATLFAGCGIVVDSDPRAEYEETNLKFTPMLDALGGSLS
ncbi:isochorismate synthase [Alkalibacillus aidingensis]|uniref:isochorismate synthase n=1 Tax=Alkalibacillus aidingensis TaxID=2747607 RepID=UPI001660D2E2|nr:isochorismate synthase [Alkalibacillus aidingensis]